MNCCPASLTHIHIKKRIAHGTGNETFTSIRENEDIGWKTRCFEFLNDLALELNLRSRYPQIRNEFLGFVDISDLYKTDELNLCVRKFVSRPNQDRNFLNAWLAPFSPEVEEQEFAFKCAQRNESSIKRCSCKSFLLQ